MAYNPFNIFRRHQRAIFAVVTVVIMFMFVLSSGMTGKADFFNWLPEWISGKTKKGEPLCKIDGDKIYIRDLDTLRRQRVMASRFMEYAATETTESLQKVLLEQMAQGSPEFKIYFQLAMQDPRMAGMMLEQLANNPKAKQADKDAAKTLEAMIAMSSVRFQASRAGTYFTNVPNRSGIDRDGINFILWEHKAKQMGIEYSPEDVKTLISKEFMGQFKSDVNVRKQLERDMPGFNMEACLAAIGTEFRVRTAQTAILPLGSASERGDRTLSAPPIFTPPYELFDFYRDKTSPTSYQALRIPVESFIPLVKETPTEDELQRLFNSRKQYEPDPSREEPGLKEPRKIKVEWVSVTGDEPYYKKQAGEWMTRTEMLAKSEVRGLLVPVPGMGPAAWVAQFAAPAAMKEPLVSAEYEFKKGEHKLQLDTRWDRPSFSNLLGPMYAAMDTSVVKPQNLVALAGGAAGSLAAFGGPIMPANLLLGATVAAEQRGRIKAGMPLFLGAVPVPGMFGTLMNGEAAYLKLLPEPLSIETFKPELIKGLTDSKARELAVNDLKKLKESIDKLTETGKAREAAAKDLIADFIKTRGVKTGSTIELQSEFTIGDDPGVAPLKALLEKEKDPHAGFRPTAPVQFGQKFFWISNPQTGDRVIAAGSYKPEFYPERAAEAPFNPFGKPDPVFLAWRTADEGAKELTVGAARPKLIEAWKRMKARDLAKAEAERLANDIRAKPSSETAFPMIAAMRDMEAELRSKTADLKARDKVKLFPIDNVAPFAITQNLTGQNPGEPTIQPFRITPSTDIPYPTFDMNKTLLDERTKPMKTVLVLADQPRDSYYVIAVADRSEQPAEKFKSQVYGLSLSRNGIGDQVKGAHRQQAMIDAHKTIVELLKKEFKYVETEEQKKKLDDREKKGGNSEE